MAKKKNTKSQQAVKPEVYIRTKARKLPIYKCYKGTTIGDTREMCILVIRQHPHGTFTLANFLLDRWCVGIKDAYWEFNIDKDELNETLRFHEERLDTFAEVDYTEAHNWIYGAHDFAMNAGIEPCDGFAIAQYILEEDDDNIELIEYDFGKDGEYCLMAKNNLEASKYIPALDKALGKGNYTVIVRPVEDEDNYSDGEWDEDEDNDWEDEEDRSWLWERVPEMEYTYKGKDYPTEITLHHPELMDTVTKETDKITKEELQNLLSLPEDTLREDLHNMILFELGKQSGKTSDELDDEVYDWNIMGNCNILLSKVGNIKDSLPVLLEELRQNQDVLDFNFGDFANILIYPALCSICQKQPSLLLPFLLEPGLSWHAKIGVCELLGQIGANIPEVRDEIITMTRELFKHYKEDLPYRKICDGSVAAFAIGIAVSMGASELLPEIEDLYNTGLIDRRVEGTIDEVKKNLLFPYEREMPVTDPYQIIDEYKRFVPHNN